MPRYIDADAFERKVMGMGEDAICDDCAYEVICLIEELPTADVVPVKRGEWIFSPDHAEGICTNCSQRIYGRPYNNNYVIVPYRYCPNCGARMDGDSE